QVPTLTCLTNPDTGQCQPNPRQTLLYELDPDNPGAGHPVQIRSTPTGLQTVLPRVPRQPASVGSVVTGSGGLGGETVVGTAGVVVVVVLVGRGGPEVTLKMTSVNANTWSSELQDALSKYSPGGTSCGTVSSTRNAPSPPNRSCDA